ncbi:uncharacterized protein LOC8281347 [Ricinus communis]|uniref:uncharacterized protein LOC8281347 n=1 Tax=Ricinus communis TaxID=3988 RepID=UPI00201B0D47|nr:uncharacterized protein LOC8281347 [Ricinus communis]
MDQNIGGGESKPSRTGLVCQYQFEDGSSQFTFLHIENENGANGVDLSLSFTAENYVQLVCSCNGLLLLSSVGDPEVKYHVFNPMSKQLFNLPQPDITRRVIRSGLAFDGHHRYQVVLVHVVGDGKEVVIDGLEMEIFSSDTGKWRRSHPDNLFLPVVAVPDFEFSELKTTPLFSNGAIHWEISGYLLVYKVNSECCELIELPNSSEDWSWQATLIYKRCLWESQGRVHYTYNDFDGIQTWVLLHEDDHDYYSDHSIYDRKKFRWALAQSVNYQDLSLKHQEAYLHLGQREWEPYDVSPLAFCEDSETMYLQIPGFVVSYNTRTKVMEKACTYKFPSMNFNCCSFLPFTIADSTFHQETASALLEGVAELPIKENLDTFSF